MRTELRQRTPALIALATAAFITVLTEALPAGVLPAMSRDLGVSESAMGQSVTIYAVGTAISAIPLFAATASWGRKRVLLLAIVGFAVANTVTAVADVYALTMVGRFVAGIAAGLVWALLVGYARRLAPPGSQGKAIAIVMAGVPVALSLGVPAGTFLGGALGWRVTFWVMTAVAVGLLVWITALVPDQPGSPGGRPPVLRTLAIPGVFPVLFVTLVYVLAYAILYTYIASFLERLGMGDRVDLALLIFGIASIAGIWAVGTYVDRQLRALSLGGLALFAIAVTMLAVLSDSPFLVYTALAAWGLASGGIPTLLQTATANAAGESADVAQAMLVTLWNAAMAGGAILGGVLLAQVGPVVFPWTGLALLTPVLLVVLFARRHAFPARVLPASRDGH
ncbi:MFS transporter [Actinokineospora sp. NBRC 105648]|uniref:MFS transporter n=1 Tax=Actinokineospora sp. NBRC 105648 TaxID=3032206 RepID=UPI0024A4555B|nr:MFS transporter [Actinokineospora sp. NBRC 105648]GLZ38597.1 MFS transporter [Actinokineospora sp. NBRC 105648]